MDLYAEIAAERVGLAELLESLDEAQLATPSLCGEWTVREVFAHLLMPLVTPLPVVLFTMARHRMDFDRANVALSRRTAERSTAELAAQLRARAASHFTPPGLGPEAPLTDCLVHGQDIRRPLRISRQFPADRLRQVLDFLTAPGAKGFVPAARLAGLALHADDLDWQAGAGAEVSGSGEAIMMAAAGRPAALDDLSGPGVALLRQRLVSD